MCCGTGWWRIGRVGQRTWSARDPHPYGPQRAVGPLPSRGEGWFDPSQRRHPSPPIPSGTLLRHKCRESRARDRKGTGSMGAHAFRNKARLVAKPWFTPTSLAPMRSGPKVLPPRGGGVAPPAQRRHPSPCSSRPNGKDRPLPLRLPLTLREAKGKGFGGQAPGEREHGRGGALVSRQARPVVQGHAAHYGGRLLPGCQILPLPLRRAQSQGQNDRRWHLLGTFEAKLIKGEGISLTSYGNLFVSCRASAGSG